MPTKKEGIELISKMKLFSLFVVTTLLLFCSALPVSAETHNVVVDKEFSAPVLVLEYEYKNPLYDFNLSLTGVHSAEFNGIIHSPSSVESGKIIDIGYNLTTENELFILVFCINFNDRNLEVEVPIESDYSSTHLVVVEVPVDVDEIPGLTITISYDILLTADLNMEMGISSDNLKLYNWETEEIIYHDFTFPNTEVEQTLIIGHHNKVPTSTITSTHTISLSAEYLGFPLGEIPVLEEEITIVETFFEMCGEPNWVGGPNNQVLITLYPESIDTTTTESTDTTRPEEGSLDSTVIVGISMGVGVIVVIAIIFYKKK